jgi:hypothetical protein
VHTTMTGPRHTLQLTRVIKCGFSRQRLLNSLAALHDSQYQTKEQHLWNSISVE